MKSIKIKIFCLGELGKVFSETFGGRLGEGFALNFIDDPKDLSIENKSEQKSEDELWMLITEYVPDIWEKHLGDDETKKLLEEVGVNFIAIHPKNHIVPVAERRMLRLMGNKSNSGRIVLAMPAMDRKPALEMLCQTFYDMILSVFGCCTVSFDLTDLISLGHNIDSYGLVYQGGGTCFNELVNNVENIKTKLIKEIDPHDVLFALEILKTSEEIALTSIVNVFKMIENVFDEDIDYFWTHIPSNDENVVTLVAFTDMYGEWDEYDWDGNVITNMTMDDLD